MRRIGLKRGIALSAALAVISMTGCGTEWVDVGDIYTQDQVALVNIERKVEVVEETPTDERITFEGASHEAGEIPADAVAYSKLLRLGWNLAGGLESEQEGIGIESEVSFGMPKITQELISYVRDAGFTTIRIPVTWHNHMENGVIDSAWMNRVKEVVDWALGEGFYVILNSQGDYNQYYPSYEKLEESKSFLVNMWTQIATAFEDKDEHLIFEGMDAPRLVGTDYEWSFPSDDPDNILPSIKEEAVGCVNELNQVFVDTIRSLGGMNSKRFLIVSCLSAESDHATEDGYPFVMPTDTIEGHLFLGIHGFKPKAFCEEFESYSTWRKDRAELGFMTNVDSNMLRKGYGVVITEMGAVNKDNLSDRSSWAKDYCFRAELTGLPCMYWDNGQVEVAENQYGLIDREKLSVFFPDLLEALKKQYE